MHLIEVIEVEVGIAQGVDELQRLQSRHRCHQVGEQCVGRNVERHTEEGVTGALVELAAQPFRSSALARSDVELEQGVARRQGHLVDLGHVPRRDDVPTRPRIGADLLDDPGDLVDRAAVSVGPGTPLMTVDRP